MEEILQGELSFMFFNGNFSHSTLKVPKTGDFRVQSEYGGTVQKITQILLIFKQPENTLKSMAKAPYTPGSME
jgi:hypothetical protein